MGASHCGFGALRLQWSWTSRSLINKYHANSLPYVLLCRPGLWTDPRPIAAVVIIQSRKAPHIARSNFTIWPSHGSDLRICRIAVGYKLMLSSHLTPLLHFLYQVAVDGQDDHAHSRARKLPDEMRKRTMPCSLGYVRREMVLWLGREQAQ